MSAKRYVQNLKKTLLKVYKSAGTNRDYNMAITKVFYDRNVKPESYEIGDLVLTDHVKIKVGLKHGLAHKYHGPFRVLAKHHNTVDYLIKKADSPKARKFLIHHNRLKRYFGQIDDVSGADVSLRELNLSIGELSHKRAYTKNPNCKRWADPITKSDPPTVQTSIPNGPVLIEDVLPNQPQLLEETNSVPNLGPAEILDGPQNKNICKICKNEAELSGMIACDLCDQWYHFKCQNIRRKPSEENEWYCKECKKTPVGGKATVKIKRSHL